MRDCNLYTIIVRMPRIYACIPWHRHGYRPEGPTGGTDRREAYATAGIDAPNPSLSLIAYLRIAQHNNCGCQQFWKVLWIDAIELEHYTMCSPSMRKFDANLSERDIVPYT